MKNIVLITASRADWGIYVPVIRAIQMRPDLKLQIRAAGDPHYLTFPLASEFDPGMEDCVVVLGDTMPMLKASMEAVERCIPVAHIHGGDLTGSIDNKIRYAISAFADWHFPSLPAHAERLKQMGYPEDRIKIVGPLGIYAMNDAHFVPGVELKQQLGLTDKPIILVIQHPVHGEAGQAGEQMEQTLEAVSVFTDYEKIIIYPNDEPNSDNMINLIETTAYKRFKNLSYLTFISLLKYSKVIVGNSSCGLVEAPLFGVFCVNIGTRQGERQRGTRTIDVDYDKGQIIQAIDYALRNMLRNSGRLYLDIGNPYADLGMDGPKIIVDTLAKMI